MNSVVHATRIETLSAIAALQSLKICRHFGM